MLLTVFAVIPLLIWIYLLIGRGMFWRPFEISVASSGAVPARNIVAVIPARNEAAVIGKAVESLLKQRFPAPIQIVVVDDGSTDGTAEIARAVGRLTVIEGRPLPPGWTGKMWAVAQGVQEAQAVGPDYILLTDADIRHSPDNVASLVQLSEANNYDLVSYMVRLSCITMPERTLIPAFVFFFLMLYPPRWIRSPQNKTAGAAGGCMLIRPEALRRVGGISSIANEVIDDCALARRVKETGGTVWLGFTDRTQSIRPYETYGEIGRMISRTAFNQLNHSALLLTATLLGLMVTYLAPVALLFSREPAAIALGATAWLLMTCAYLPMVRFYKISALWAAALPGIAVFYSGATIYSAWRYWRGSGGEWKGRTQDVPS